MAVHLTRQIFKQVDLGVGRVKYYRIPKADADGFDIITNLREAIRLTRKWSGPNRDAIDVFIVPEYNVKILGTIYAGTGHGIGDDKYQSTFNGVVFGIRNLDGSLVNDPEIGGLLARE
jgi:hypothetical protein